MVFESLTKSLSSVGYKCIQEDTFVPNLVQTGREMAVKSSRVKKNNITEIVKNSIIAAFFYFLSKVRLSEKVSEIFGQVSEKTNLE